MEANLIGVAHFEKKDYKTCNKEMTPSEICNLLEYIKRGYIPDYNYSGTEDDFEKYKMHMAMRKAIKCVKRYSRDWRFTDEI